MKLKISINIPLWGSSYISTFTKYCLPAQLADGNLPSIRERVSSYNIYTKRQDADEIQDSDSFKILKKTVPCKLFIIDSMFNSIANKYSLNSSVFRFALNQAYNKSLGCILLNSDHLISEKTFLWILKIIDSGIRLIEIPGPRTDLDNVSLCLLKQRKQNILAIKSHDLLSLWYKNMHQDIKYHFVDGKENGINPSHLYWDIKRFGVIARCCHLFPCAIVPSRVIPKNFITVDDDLMKNYKLSKTKTLIERNANRFFICELSRPGNVMGPSAEKNNIYSFFKFFDRNSTSNLNRYKTEILLSNKKIQKRNPVRLRSLLYVRNLLTKYNNWVKTEQLFTEKSHKANFIYKDKYDLSTLDTPLLHFSNNLLIGDKIVLYDKPYQLNTTNRSKFKPFKFLKTIHRDLYNSLLQIMKFTIPIKLLVTLVNKNNPSLVRIACVKQYINKHKKNKYITLICQNPFLSPGTIARVLSDSGSLFLASKTGRIIKQNKQLKEGLQQIFGQKAVKIFSKRELELDLVGISDQSIIDILNIIRKLPIYKIGAISNKCLFEDVVLHAIYYNLLK